MQPRRIQKKRFCKFCSEKTPFIDYKEVKILRHYLTDKGKMLPQRVTGTCAKHQRELATAIKRARNIVLLSFVEK